MRLKKDVQGSITLEAAIFMPFFIIFLVFLMFIIKLALTDIALNRAVTETGKQIATQIYPVNRVIGSANEALNNQPKYAQMKQDVIKAKDEMEAELKKMLGNEGYQMLISQPLESAGEAVKNTAFTMAVKHFIAESNEGILNKDNVKVVKVDIADNFLKIVVHYQLDIPVPFLESKYILQKQSTERVWLGS
jgi:hypothetical protein